MNRPAKVRISAEIDADAYAGAGIFREHADVRRWIEARRADRTPA